MERELSLKKKIELDNKYLFRITQQVKNNSNSSIDLYPYAQMTRNKIPMIFRIFIFSMRDLSAYLMMS